MRTIEFFWQSYYNVDILLISFQNNEILNLSIRTTTYGFSVWLIESFSDNSQQYHEKGGKLPQNDQIMTIKFMKLTILILSDATEAHLDFMHDQNCPFLIWSVFKSALHFFSCMTKVFPSVNVLNFKDPTPVSTAFSFSNWSTGVNVSWSLVVVTKTRSSLSFSWVHMNLSLLI